MPPGPLFVSAVCVAQLTLDFERAELSLPARSRQRANHPRLSLSAFPLDMTIRHSSGPRRPP